MFAGASALLLAACAPAQPHSATTPADPAEAIVYVIEREWHTDIGFPVEELTGPLNALERGFPGVRFLTFGFGERQFVISRETSVRRMLAALLPSQSALLMTALSASPEAAFGEANVVTLIIPKADLERIKARIWQEFELSSQGDPVMLSNGPYTGSVFYAAKDTYDGLYTCNTWTATMLRSGGLPMPTTGILFSGQVIGMARWMRSQQALLHGR